MERIEGTLIDASEKVVFSAGADVKPAFFCISDVVKHKMLHHRVVNKWICNGLGRWTHSKIFIMKLEDELREHPSLMWFF